MIVHCELLRSTHRLIREMVTIGKYERASGMRHGCAYDPSLPIADLGRYINDMGDGPDYWAKIAAQRLDAIDGPRCFDLSGWWGAYSISRGDPVAPYLNAVERVVTYMDRDFDEDDTIWCDCEPADGTPLSTTAKPFQSLFRSGLVGRARVVAVGIFDGVSSGAVALPNLVPGTADNRSSYVNIRFRSGTSPRIHLDGVSNLIRWAQAAHMDPICHVTGGLYDSDGKPYSDADKSLYKQTADLCRSLGVQNLILYNRGGQGPNSLDTEVDMDVRRADDAAFLAAWGIA